MIVRVIVDVELDDVGAASLDADALESVRTAAEDAVAGEVAPNLGDSWSCTATVSELP